MKTKEEILKSIIGLEGCLNHMGCYGEVEEAMEQYAIEYHKGQVKNLNIPDVIKSVCDKNLCKHYNKLFNRCKFMNDHCALKQTVL